MSEIKWIKITADIFDDEKILLIESLPEADSIIVIWFKLLCLAGKQNNNGVFIMSNRIAYTDKMLATIFRRNENTVQLALKTFEQFGMIETIDGIITIPKWEKHQNIESSENIRENRRQRNLRYRAKKGKETQDVLQDVSQDVLPDVLRRLGDASKENKETEKETEKESSKEKDKEKDKENKEIPPIKDPNTIVFGEKSGEETAEKEEKTPFIQIKDLFLTICTSFPKIQKLTDSRKTAITARWKEYPNLATFQTVFEKAEASKFLKGESEKGWKADFDFLMTASKFTRVLEGRYDNDRMGLDKPKKEEKKPSSFDNADFFNAALQRSYGNK